MRASYSHAAFLIGLAAASAITTQPAKAQQANDAPTMLSEQEVVASRWKVSPSFAAPPEQPRFSMPHFDLQSGFEATRQETGSPVPTFAETRSVGVSLGGARFSMSQGKLGGPFRGGFLGTDGKKLTFTKHFY